jgi:DNA-binding CsgD family transcriptional regulator
MIFVNPARRHIINSDDCAAKVVRVLTTMDGEFWSVFQRSRNAMLLADDDRRYVAGNDAALALLGVTLDELRLMRIDDLAPSANGDVHAMWADFLARGSMTGRWHMITATGEIEIEFSATARVAPGRHLAIILAPAPAEPERPPAQPTRERLTVREREVVAAIAQGHTSAEIARRMFLSQATIETHVRKAMLRLGARNRAHLIALALQAGEL